MFLGRTAFQYMIINLVAYLRHCFKGVDSWSPEDFKARVGISKATFQRWVSNIDTGTKKINLASLCIISLATGIRVKDLTTKLVNLKTYDFDYKVSKREFQTHVFSKFGISSQFGLDKLKRFKEK